MGSHSEVALADEALKGLFDRFKANQTSELSRELSEALLARGHANEALHVTELGIQAKADDPEIRIQRAAALLALGRPRVAYVELLRALAIEPTHHRGMRLLGRVFVEAGAPERAAKLLARRLAAKAQEPNADRVRVQVETEGPRPEARPEPRIPVELESQKPKPETPKTDKPKTKLEPPKLERPPPVNDLLEAATVPEKLAAPRVPKMELSIDRSADISPVSQLFAELTSDLGLTPADPVKSRVQVTQVVRTRKRGEEDTARSLSSIDGPIVDRTQPGELEIDRDAPGLPPMPPAPATLFDVVTSPQFSISNIDDEPLFNESMPFEVRPVESKLEDNDTIEDALPAGLDMAALRKIIDQPQKPAEEEPAFPMFRVDGEAPVKPLAPLMPIGRDETPVPAAPVGLVDSGEASPDLEPAYLKRFKRSARTAPQVDLPQGPTSENGEARPFPTTLVGVVVALLVLAALWLAKDHLRALLGG
ncbi:MAG: hypothetical protein HYV07_28880 [Deltaproteobacteria bacterium]|nr:hypothetical protein [Deltaproteobacteria bacterium]